VAPPYQVTLVTGPRLVNLSTRATVETGAAILIGGFIVEGPSPKKVIIRAIGPSLAAFGLQNLLPNPQIALFDATPAQIASNDDWQTNSPADIQAIQNANLAPGDPRESALVQTLAPGAYTVQLSGVGGITGNALLEVYDVDPNSVTTAINISTRAMVETGNNVVIGGFILAGDNTNVLLRGIGTSLEGLVPNALVDPTLELHDEAGNVIAFNDDWISAPNASAIMATGQAPTQNFESAIMMVLPAGKYTCVLRGINNSTGIGRIDVISNP